MKQLFYITAISALASCSYTYRLVEIDHTTTSNKSSSSSIVVTSNMDLVMEQSIRQHTFTANYTNVSTTKSDGLSHKTLDYLKNEAIGVAIQKNNADVLILPTFTITQDITISSFTGSHNKVSIVVSGRLARYENKKQNNVDNNNQDVVEQMKLINTNIERLIQSQPTQKHNAISSRASMWEYINGNINTPTWYNGNGRVTLDFIIDENGGVKDVHILSGIQGCDECNNEAMRVVKEMPTWTTERNEKITIIINMKKK